MSGHRCKLTEADGKPWGALFRCPGCDDNHHVVVTGPNAWSWNGSVDLPTFSPSVKVDGPIAGVMGVCHSFVTDGRIQFIADSTHALAGQTVDLPEWAP